MSRLPEERYPAAERQPLATCQACGKQAFTSKNNAKRAARIIYPGRKMRVYNCHGDPRWWHLTSQDAARAAEMRDRYAPPCRTECDC